MRFLPRFRPSNPLHLPRAQFHVAIDFVLGLGAEKAVVEKWREKRGSDDTNKPFVEDDNVKGDVKTIDEEIGRNVQINMRPCVNTNVRDRCQ